MISQITPAGRDRPSRAKSTAASKLAGTDEHPAVTRPQGEHVAWTGDVLWPRVGIRMVATVIARSRAEIPVLTFRLASTDTANAVSKAEVFSETMSGILSWSRRSPMIGMQISPRP